MLTRLSKKTGELLYYGGMAGIAVTAVVTLIVIAVLAGSRKRLRRKMNEEYGSRR